MNGTQEEIYISGEINKTLDLLVKLLNSNNTRSLIGLVSLVIVSITIASGMIDSEVSKHDEATKILTDVRELLFKCRDKLVNTHIADNKRLN